MSRRWLPVAMLSFGSLIAVAGGQVPNPAEAPAKHAAAS